MTTDTAREHHAGRAQLFSNRPYPRGYRAPRELDDCIKEAHRTSITATLVAVVVDYCYSLGAICTAYVMWTNTNFAVGLLATVLACAVTARGQRALETLLHEGSHKNWSRRAQANHMLCALLAATPVLAELTSYRQTHRLHHSNYGTRRDDDRRRYVELGLDELSRAHLGVFVLGIASRLPRYFVGWYRAAGSNAYVLGRFAAWLALVATVAYGLSGAWQPALFLPGCWTAALLLMLPVIRMIGEAGEHIYMQAHNVFDTTVTNCGLIHRLVLHPHGDGYHTAHHMWPAVPHHAIGKLHRIMMARDPAGYGARVKIRTRILQDP
jgi:fatty acid desaturase